MDIIKKEEKIIVDRLKDKSPKLNLKSQQKCIDLFKAVLNAQEVKSPFYFDFLVGEKGTKLPVDSYFPEFKLVVEYMGEQHYNEVGFMNQRKGRKAQRKRYDDLRVEKLKENNIKLIQFRFDDGLTPEIVKKKLQEVGIF